MNADFHKSFDKQFMKLPAKQQLRVRQAVKKFLQNPKDPELYNHPLKGGWRGYRSISAAGDLRLHFKVLSRDRVMFVAVGSHSQLYLYK